MTVLPQFGVPFVLHVVEDTDKNNIEYETGKWKILWLAFDDMYGYGKNNFIDFTKYSEFDNIKFPPSNGMFPNDKVLTGHSGFCLLLINTF